MTDLSIENELVDSFSALVAAFGYNYLAEDEPKRQTCKGRLSSQMAMNRERVEDEVVEL